MRSEFFTIEQNRAQKALAIVNAISENDLKEYKSAVEKFSSLVLNSGLLQAVTFYKEKHPTLYKHLADYFQERLNGKDLVEYLTSLPISEYRFITKETLAFVTWLKRFTNAKVKEKELKEGAEDATGT